MCGRSDWTKFGSHDHLRFPSRLSMLLLDRFLWLSPIWWSKFPSRSPVPSASAFHLKNRWSQRWALDCWMRSKSLFNSLNSLPKNAGRWWSWSETFEILISSSSSLYVCVCCISSIPDTTSSCETILWEMGFFLWIMLTDVDFVNLTSKGSRREWTSSRVR